MGVNSSSVIGGYANAVIAVVGTLVNITTFLVLISHNKLRKQTTTVIILALTALNILYNALILSSQSVMYLHPE